jgi:queuine tRNA-ribosyltransferase
MKRSFFKTKNGEIPLPVFFPDATRAVIRSLDSEDIKNSKTPGVLVNTFHLWQGLSKEILNSYGGVGNFMNWKGGIISDSGGFQVMSVIKSGGVKGKVTDEGVVFYPTKNTKKVLTPEESVSFQMELGSDMVVVLDDFTDPASEYKEADVTVKRTIEWAKRSKNEFERICKIKNLSEESKPYILGVVQGGKFQDLRVKCATELSKIGFDGFGYGGWPLNDKGDFDYESAKTIVDNTPEGYFLYGLGIGKPEDIRGCYKLGFNIFDCVLPTRDARHERLYVYNFDSIENINIDEDKFYSFYNPGKEVNYNNPEPVSKACDCLLCTNYSKGYLAHLFKIGDFTAGRLASIHNLRFYSLLMEKLRDKK